MTSNVPTITPQKRRRIMIITADESIIDEIEKINDPSLLEQIVLESEVNNNRSINQQTKIQPKLRKNKSHHGPLICVVCGSSANGYNFGAIACECCKAFFRRNARKNPNAFPCRNQRNCKITFETRRDCWACRLFKCFDNGMTCDRLSTDEQKAMKRYKIEENRKLVLHSNCETNNQQSQLVPSIFFDDTPIDTSILFTDFTNYLAPQPQQALLSSEDLQRIETISLSYRKRIELAARDGLPWDPSMNTLTFIESINSQSVPVMRLLSFFKQIPEFNQLNVDDKVTLIKNNLLIILGINCTLYFNTETNQIIETDSDVPWNTQFVQIVHGYNILMQSQKIFGALLHIAKYDEKIIHLALITLVLTKSFSIIDTCDEPILNDQMAVYRAQNYYTELLWKYMETVHGHEQAVHLFSKLIVHVISWQTINTEMRNNILRILSPTDISELLPVMKSVLRIS